MEARPEKSCVINVSSLMESHPMPGFSLMSACKAHLSNFSRALTAEYAYTSNIDKNSKIDVVLYSPSFISTKINGLPYVPGIIPRPLSAVSTAFHDVGRFSYTNGRLVDSIVGCFFRFGHKYFPGLLDRMFYNSGVAAHKKK